MKLRQFFIFIVTIETLFIYPGSIKAQDSTVTSVTYQPPVFLQCPRNFDFCTCDDNKRLSCGSRKRLRVGEDEEQQLERELTAIKEESRKNKAQGRLQIDLFSLYTEDIKIFNLKLLDEISIRSICLGVFNSNVYPSKLEKIVGGPDQVNSFLYVESVTISRNSKLDDAGLGDTLKAFSSSTYLTRLSLNENSLTGSDGNSDIFPGFSSLKFLEHLDLSGNKISRISTRHFEHLSGLRSVDLSNNRILSVQGNLLFVPNNLQPLEVDLRSNLINKISSPIQNSLEGNFTNNKYWVILDLRDNKVSTLPFGVFYDFLRSNEKNRIWLWGNPLVCDGKVQWLRDNKRFNSQIKDAQCSNLNAECEGESVFNSKYFNSVVEEVADNGVLTIVLSVVIPAILILILLAFFLWRKFKKGQDHVLYLSAKDIDEFRKGNSSMNAQVLLAAIMSQPFDESLEIPREELEFDEKNVLGSGQYGIVFKGIFKAKAGNVCVALKTVKPSIDLETFKLLLFEIKMLAYVGNHQNIVQLIGASTANLRKRDVLVVLEFCQNGDLRSYLLKRKTNFQGGFVKCSKDAGTKYAEVDLQNQHENILTSVQLVKFAVGIANGLKFLRTKNVIHGDLAARNILLSDKLDAKITDFGLSRQLTNYQNYLKTTKNYQCAMPFKWMSIEAIKDMNFSICSDIWSFGVILYEIFSLGETPYPGLAVDQEFLPRLLRGYRMDKPQYADKQIYELMLDTWKFAPLDRPSSDEIHCRLHQILDQIAKGTKSNFCVYIDC